MKMDYNFLKDCKYYWFYHPYKILTPYFEGKTVRVEYNYYLGITIKNNRYRVNFDSSEHAKMIDAITHAEKFERYS